MEMRCCGCMEVKRQRPICEHCGYDERQANELHQLPVGTLLRDQYIVGKVLGQGGFGITYLGWDESLQEPVAIKEYFPNGQVSRNASRSPAVECTAAAQTFAEGRERFLNEARTLAKLRKVGSIVQVMSFFSENNTAYIVMEYVEGITLLEYMRQRGGRLTVSETLAILQPVLKALSRVHQAGMIHRDISPDNIMLQKDGTVKLLDFGTARDVDRSGGLAHSTQAVLKHGFAPMEQYSSGRSLDRRADEYALAATVWCCLTGQVPPDAPSMIMDGARIDWSGISGLTEQQRKALEKATAFRADDRFDDLDALHEALFGAAPEHTHREEETTGREQPPQPPAPIEIPETLPMPDIPAPGPVVIPEPRPMPEKEQREPPAPPEPKKALPKWLLPGVAVVVIACLFVALLGTRETPENPQAQGTAATEEPPVETRPEEPARPDQWRENVLRADIPEYDKEIGYPVFGTGYSRESIASITILDSIRYAPQDSWDVSEAQDGRVLAWVEPSGEMYDLFIAATGGIRAPEVCSSLFMNYKNVHQIFFIENLHVTEDVVDMERMFYDCRSLTQLDVSGFDTSNVTNMCNLFFKCASLTQLDVSGFNTAKVTNMSNLFYECTALQAVDVSGFDTAQVTTMARMFSCCLALEKVNVSGFDTSRVTNMESMFQQCNSLREADVSGFKTSKVENIRWMFYECLALKELDLSNWNTAKVTDMYRTFKECPAEVKLGKWETDSLPEKKITPAYGDPYYAYDEFMDEGRLYNGKDWKKLFKK